MFGRILVPFDNLLHLQESLCQALELAENLAAEVILLRVNLPKSDSSLLYSELKALQAQCASLPVPVRIETVAGRANEAIVHYAAQHGISLIFSPEIARLVNEKTSAQKTALPGAREDADFLVGDAIGGLKNTAFARPAQGMAGAG